MEQKEKKLNIFEKYLTVWVLLCIGTGILLGKIAPQLADTLDSFSVYKVAAYWITYLRVCSVVDLCSHTIRMFTK